MLEYSLDGKKHLYRGNCNDLFDMIREFYFFETYKCAHKIYLSVSNENTYSWIEWANPEVESCIIKYSKKSIFEHYIYAVLLNDFERYYGDSNNNYFFGCEIINLESGCDLYEIEYIPFNFFKYNQNGPIDTKCDLADDEFPYEDVSKWIGTNQGSFKILWKKIASETFQLLFRDRELLLRFNQSLAQSLFEYFSPEYNNSNSGIKRCKYIPKWCRNAIFHRDMGRCVLCNKDLTQLINTENKLHYDHMVPLSEYGTNDPCNLQLLCQECNLSKSNKREITSIKYKTWW